MKFKTIKNIFNIYFKPVWVILETLKRSVSPIKGGLVTECHCYRMWAKRMQAGCVSWMLVAVEGSYYGPVNLQLGVNILLNKIKLLWTEKYPFKAENSWNFRLKTHFFFQDIPPGVNQSSFRNWWKIGLIPSLMNRRHIIGIHREAAHNISSPKHGAYFR